MVLFSAAGKGIRRHWPVILLFACALGIFSGCTTAPLQYQALSPASERQTTRAELTDTPFFPQEAYQCGPAALAAVLQHSGVETATPERLAEQVYLPGRRGSLQTELLAATRRADRVPYVLEPRLEHLLAEIDAGNPVLVLQNLGLRQWPKWHYAVVVGFDLEAGQVMLRSGVTERQVMTIRRFERSWQQGDYWGLVVAAPERIPATANVARYLAAVASLEQQGRWASAARSYQAAVQRWPDNPAGHMGLGNVAYHEGAYAEAESRFRSAIDVAPDLPAAHHNLAWALVRQGRLEEARLAAETTERVGADHPRYRNTVAAIEAAKTPSPRAQPISRVNQ